MATVKNEESFRQLISINVTILKFCGIVRPDDKTSLKMVLSYCSTIVAGGTLVALTYVYVYNFFNNGADPDIAMESLSFILSFLGASLRFVNLYWSRGTIQKMLQTFEDLWKILSLQERQHVTSYVNGAKNFTYVFLLECIVTIFSYSIAPLIANSDDENLNTTRVLPYFFITEVHQSPYYEIVYFLQISATLNASLTAVGVEMIGPVLITTVCGHMTVIREQLRNIHSLEETNEGVLQAGEGDHKAGEESGREIRKNHHVDSLSSEFGNCINYHKTILAICTDIEKLTNYVFLTQLFGSTYILSTIGFKLTGNDPDKYKYFAYVLIGLLQLLICTWPPDALLTESQAVASAAYFTPWYHWPSELKKSICFVILRAQKPVQLTAGKIVHLSLETFAAVSFSVCRFQMVSSAVSFFMLLQSFK